ncbi:MAG: hypothetical protein QM715_06880 [Nibricoccus sp.]
MKTPLQQNRGSILLVTMIFVVLVTFMVASYLGLTSTSLKVSHRMYHSIAALDVAESGLEEAMWSINNGGINTTGGWTINGADATKTVSNYLFGQNKSGSAKIYVRNFASQTATRVVACRASLALPNAGTVERWIELTLSPGISPYGLPPTGKRFVKFSGQPTVDSWNSDPDFDSSTPYVPYSAATAHDKGGVAAVEITADITVSNGTVWGTAAVGSNSLSSITLGPKGLVGPYGTPQGTMPGASTDFSVALPNIEQPTGGTVTAISGTTLTGSNDPLHPTVYTASSLSFNKETLTVNGYVELRLTAPEGLPALTITGNGGGINIDASIGSIVMPIDPDNPSGPTHIVNGPRSGLTIYTAGDVSIQGNGVANQYTSGSGTTMGQPSLFQVKGTGTTPGVQNITIGGNGNLSGVVYAPNADITLNGFGNSGNFYGTAIGNSLTFNGSNVAVHYDESLNKLGGATPARISKWRELVTPNEKLAYSGKL